MPPSVQRKRIRRTPGATARRAEIFGTAAAIALAQGLEFSHLWTNARHLSRDRTALRDRGAEQEAAWCVRLTGLIGTGVGRNEFRTDDPYTTTLQILVVLDGLGAHPNNDTRNRPAAVSRMAATTADERELGLLEGPFTRTDAPLTAPLIGERPWVVSSHSRH
ncbi:MULTISPECIES: hypothetical protein [unclassified Streptomyces]|uniref:hypothetical protein n=1 Tax=unclassified Streptomyces TaxID=2593676 RepID=UPI0036ED70E4